MSLSATASLAVIEEAVKKGVQLPLVQLVETDDLALANCEEAEWFQVLKHFEWRRYKEVAAKYYEALYRFNQDAAERRQGKETEPAAPPETADEARQRLLFERPTAGNGEAPLLFEPPAAPKLAHIDPAAIAPGRTPFRWAGKQPKCFFALFKSFIGVTLMGHPPAPENVHRELVNNPAFARLCGFTHRDARGGYRQRHVPSLRKLEQFDQIMTASGLWNESKWSEIRTNINRGVVVPEPEIVHDTTHYHAYSSFEVVKYENAQGKKENAQGKKEKKSQSRPTKPCGCQDRKTCSHPWVLADEGAGTVVKSNHKLYWAHKASILVLPRQGVPLDAVAATDAASHDARTLIPSLDRLYDHLPEFSNHIRYVLDDGAAYDHSLQEKVLEDFGMLLRASLNPRRRRPVTDNLPRGMSTLTPYGELLCMAGRAMDYRGVRGETERFIYGPPRDEHGAVFCPACAHKPACCPRAETGRQVTIPFDSLPHIFPEDPPMAKRFQAMMTRRTAVERAIKRMKCDLGSGQLTKRGNPAFQARLDKTLIAIHLLLRI